MLFLWTITKRGKILLDGDGFKQIVASHLPPSITCQEVSFSGDQNLLNIYLVLPDKDDPQKRLSLIDKFDNLFRPSGLAVHINWTQRAPQNEDPSGPVWRSPLFWSVGVAGLIALTQLGLMGIFRVAVAAVLAYVVSWFTLSEDGRKQIDRLIKEFRR